MESCYNDTSNKGEEDNYSYAMELASSSVLPMVLMAAVELKVLDIIAKAGPGAQLSPSEIASQLPAATRNPDAPEMLDRMLRLLASHSILTCSVDLSSDQPLLLLLLDSSSRGGCMGCQLWPTTLFQTKTEESHPCCSCSRTRSSWPAGKWLIHIHTTLIVLPFRTPKVLRIHESVYETVQCVFHGHFYVTYQPA